MTTPILLPKRPDRTTFPGSDFLLITFIIYSVISVYSSAISRDLSCVTPREVTSNAAWVLAVTPMLAVLRPCQCGCKY